MITGGALGLLFAPESGAAVKQKIQEYMDRLIDVGKAAAEIRRQDWRRSLRPLSKGSPIRLTPAKESRKSPDAKRGSASAAALFFVLFQRFCAAASTNASNNGSIAGADFCRASGCH